MSSTSASDGTYTLTVTFDVGTDLNTSLALVQNLANSALAQLPGGVQPQGRHSPEGLPEHLAGGQPLFRRRPVRRGVPLQLRRHQPAEPTGPAAGHRPGASHRGRLVQHAGLAGPEAAPGVRAHDRRCPGRHPGAKRPGRGRPARRAPGAGRSTLPVHDQRPRPAFRCAPVRGHHRQVRHRHGPADRARARCRPGGPEPADLQQLFAIHRSQVGPDPRVRPAGRQCHRDRQSRVRGDGRDGQAVSRRA